MKILFSKKSYLSFKSPVGKKGSPVAKDVGKGNYARDNEDSFHTAPMSFSERTRLSSSSSCIFEEPTPKERKVSKTLSHLSKLLGGKKRSKNCVTESYRPLFKDETSKTFDLSAALSAESSDRDVERSEQSGELKSCDDLSIRSFPINVVKNSSHLEFKASEDQTIKSLPISAMKSEENQSVGTLPTDDVDEFATDDDGDDGDGELVKSHAINSITASPNVTSSPMSDIKPIRYKRLSQAEKQKRTEKMNSIRINRTCGSSLQKAETALPTPFASATNKSRRKSRRNKSDLLDITEHARIGLVPQSKSLDIPDLPYQPERKTKKTKTKRTKVPSNGKTKKKSRKTHASALASRKNGSSKRIDYTGQISESENITKELHRLGSLVELMMSRMDLYEKQSDCLVEASLEWSKISQPPEPPGQSPTEKRLMMETSAQDKWIHKLEEIQQGYMARLVTTQSQLKTLRNEQAQTDKEIHQEVTVSDKLRILWNDNVPENDPKDGNESMDRKIKNITPATIDDESKTDTNQKVQFDPSVKVATVLSRHDMPPNEKYKYWCGDGDDEEVMTEQMLTILTKKWQQKREEESKHQTEEDLPPINYTIHIQD